MSVLCGGTVCFLLAALGPNYIRAYPVRGEWYPGTIGRANCGTGGFFVEIVDRLVLECLFALGPPVACGNPGLQPGSPVFAVRKWCSGTVGQANCGTGGLSVVYFLDWRLGSKGYLL